LVVKKSSGNPNMYQIRTSDTQWK